MFRSILFSSQGQRLEIRFVAAPVAQENPAQIPAPREEKTLRELNEMDPYGFAVSALPSVFLPLSVWFLTYCVTV